MDVLENKKDALSPYERVKLARSKDRALITDYIEYLFEDFTELKGDRLYAEDSSILAGIALFHNKPVTIIGHRKGRSTEENVKFNFGMTSPSGYRKAVRLMKQAEKFKRPVICFIDTPGAYPGMEAEAMGQSNAIAESIACMARLNVPVISIITGEGSSGGALAIGVSDKVYMLENAVYSILSPEGFASIIWKDAKQAERASEIMKITSFELLEYGLIDGVILENDNYMDEIDKLISKAILQLSKMKPSALVNERYKKYRYIEGRYKPD